MRRAARLAGLGLAVGAFFRGPMALAQVPDSLARVRADSAARARADSVARARVAAAALQDSVRRADATRLRADSLHREDLRIIEAQRRIADSIKAPTPASELPPSLEVGDALSWDRATLFASGALTLGDLLERVPGMTLFRTGWLGSPETAALAGDFGRLRVFYDGLELDVLDDGPEGIADVSLIQLWTLESVRIERGAGEVRVHLRTWRVRSLTPRTRVDVGTGDAETNGYRGYFGRRFGAGQVLQVGGFQFTSRDPRGVGDVDQLSIFTRLGWARGRFGVDGALLRTARERTEQPRLLAIGRANLPPLKVINSDAYVRAGFSDTASGVWAQLMAASRNVERSRNLTDEGGTTSTDTSLRAVRRNQYVGAVGWTRSALTLSVTARLKEVADGLKPALMARASWESPLAAVSLLAEDRREADLRRVEAATKLSPFESLALTAAVGRTMPGESAARPASLDVRAEVALMWRRAWISAGILSRDTAFLSGPALLDTGFMSTATGAARGTFVTVRGKVWKAIGLDLTAILWDSASAYRPKYQSRSQVFLQTDMRHKYPSGNLGFLLAVTQDYRSRAAFPLSPSTPGAQLPPPLRSSEFRAYGILFEIKLLQATLTYQFRNLANAQYEQVPGFVNMRAAQFYGVRWDFVN